MRTKQVYKAGETVALVDPGTPLDGCPAKLKSGRRDPETNLYTVRLLEMRGPHAVKTELQIRSENLRKYDAKPRGERPWDIHNNAVRTIVKIDDNDARRLLDSLTPEQLDEVGEMFGMSNLGQGDFDTPEGLAENDEMYDMMLEEINDWRKRLRSKKEKWGCFQELPHMCEEAKRRCPVKSVHVR